MTSPFLSFEVGTSGLLCDRDSSSQEALQTIVTKSRSHKVVLHFHGGLVPEEAAIQEHERLGRMYQQAGYLPVFCVWRTGVLEILRGNYLKIASSVFFQTIFDWTMRCLIGFSQVGKGFGQVATRIVLESGFEDACSQFDTKGPLHINKTASIEQCSERELPRECSVIDLIKDDKIWLTNDLQESLNPDANKGKVIGGVIWSRLAKGIARICFAVWNRKKHNRDHGLHATLIEEIIREFSNERFRNAIWIGIKDKAQNMVSTTGTCHFLVKKLVEETEIVTLVGHSAGSIPICHLAKEFGPQIDNIVLFAPACRSDLYLDAVSSNKNSLDRVRVFTMSDELEKADTMLKGLVLGDRYIYPRSLLYFVSGVLESEADDRILGMERFMQDPPFNEPQDHQVRNSLRGKVALSVSLDETKPGFRCNARSHTNFLDDPVTCESLINLLNETK